MRDLLLKLDAYPDPTPDWVIGYANTLSRRLDARLAAAICEVHFAVSTHWLADALAHVDDVLSVENARSQANARLLADLFRMMTPAQIAGPIHEYSGAYPLMPHGLLAAARLCDLLIVQAGNAAHTGQQIEDIVFDCGRPVLVLPEAPFQRTPERIVVAWDGSRAAARALADALPLLRKAGAVIVGTIEEVAKDNSAEARSLLEQHLQSHGISAKFLSRPAGHGDTATALFDLCAEVAADLLVAGAYGHSKAREFWLGGVTRKIIAHPPLPTLMSH